MGQVRKPRHLKALVELAIQRGVALVPGTPVCGFDRQGEKIEALETTSGRRPAGQFVVAGGAWSSQLLQATGCAIAVRPLRGQIALVAMQPSPIRHVVNIGPRYLVPRGDGRLLGGSTEEVAGFDNPTTAGRI